MSDAIGPDEDAFLKAHSRSFLLGLRADGSPTGWPLIGFYPGEAMEFSTYGRAQKVRTFQRNPNASCVVAPFGGDQALMMRGTVEIRADQRGPSTGEKTRADAKEKVEAAAGGNSDNILKNPKRLMLRFAPAEARFVPGFGVTEGPWH